MVKTYKHNQYNQYMDVMCHESKTSRIIIAEQNIERL